MESTFTLFGDRPTSHRVERDALKAFREVLRMFSDKQTVEAFREVQRTGLLLDHIRAGPSEMSWAIGHGRPRGAEHAA
jgi:hypothetical protein